MANIGVQKSSLKNTKNGQYLCQKNGRPNLSIEPGPGHPLAVACVSSLQPLAASEANTHTQVFLYDTVAMILFTLDTALI